MDKPRQSTESYKQVLFKLWQTGTRYKKAIQWVTAVLCVFWIGLYFYQNREDLELFRNLSIWQIAVLPALFTLHFSLYSLNFLLIIRTCTKQRISFAAFFKAFILGRFLNNIVPQAGNIFRGIYLKRLFGISYTRYVSSFFCFIWIDAAINIVLSTVVFGLYEPSMKIGGVSIWLFLATMALIWFLPVFFERLFKRFTPPWSAASWLHTKASELLSVSIQSLSNKKMLLAIISVNAVNFANNMLIFYLCSFNFASEVTIPILAVFFILLKISSYLIITPGNIGIREIAYGFIGSQMGLLPGQGMVLSIFYRLFGMFVVNLFGIYFGGMGLLFSKPSKVVEEKEIIETL